MTEFIRGAWTAERMTLTPAARNTASKEARHTTCFEDLIAALRVWAKGLFSAEAAVELLIGHRLWLYRDDFREIGVEFGWETFSGRVMAAVDFEAVAGALDAGVLPCSGSEGQVLRLAASIAAGVPVDLAHSPTDGGLNSQIGTSEPSSRHRCWPQVRSWGQYSQPGRVRGPSQATVTVWSYGTMRARSWGCCSGCPLTAGQISGNAGLPGRRQRIRCISPKRNGWQSRFMRLALREEPPVLAHAPEGVSNRGMCGS
jgi:hypothetical protein